LFIVVMSSPYELLTSHESILPVKNKYEMHLEP